LSRREVELLGNPSNCAASLTEIVLRSALNSLRTPDTFSSVLMQLAPLVPFLLLTQSFDGTFLSEIAPRGVQCDCQAREVGPWLTIVERGGIVRVGEPSVEEWGWEPHRAVVTSCSLLRRWRSAPACGRAGRWRKDRIRSPWRGTPTSTAST